MSRHLTIGIYSIAPFETEDGTEIAIHKVERELKSFQNHEIENAIEYFLEKVGHQHKTTVRRFLLTPWIAT